MPQLYAMCQPQARAAPLRTCCAPGRQASRRVTRQWAPPGSLMNPTDRGKADAVRPPPDRTFAWLGKCRRLSKDDEALPETTEALVYLAMIRLMLRRLGRDPPLHNAM